MHCAFEVVGVKMPSYLFFEMGAFLRSNLIFLVLVGTPCLSDITSGIRSALEILNLASGEIDSHLDDSWSEFPFATISYAQTLDGSIAPLSRSRMNISSSISFKLLHSLRAKHQGILVGINTCIGDNPLLNVRDPLPGIELISPRPIIIDSNLRVTEAHIRLQNPIICTCTDSQDSRWSETLLYLERYCGGGEILTCSRGPDGRYVGETIIIFTYRTDFFE